LSATVPSSLAAGAHTVTVNATSGGAQLASDPVTVQSAGASSGSSGSSVASPSNGVITLPRTGAEIARFVAIALFIGGLGLILVGLSRFVLERR
jgi:hypothetical protein